MSVRDQHNLYERLNTIEARLERVESNTDQERKEALSTLIKAAEAIREAVGPDDYPSKWPLWNQLQRSIEEAEKAL